MRIQIKKQKSGLTLTFLFLLICSFPPLLNAQVIERGGWLWKSPQNEYGSVKVIGDPKKQAALLQMLKKWQIKRLYLSCDLTDATLEKTARFNQALSKEGIRVHYLISDQTWNSSKNAPKLFQYLNDTVLKFNKSRKVKEELFVGISFDLEHHIEMDWKQKSPKAKADALEELAEVYQLTRNYLDQNGGKNLLLSSTLTTWYDSLPPSLGGEGSIGWENQRKRDQFFEKLAHNLNFISLMAFEIPKIDHLMRQVSWERAELKEKAIISLRVNLGMEWKNKDEMENAIKQIEKLTGTGIDIQSIDRIMEK